MPVIARKKLSREAWSEAVRERGDHRLRQPSDPDFPDASEAGFAMYLSEARRLFSNDNEVKAKNIDTEAIMAGREAAGLVGPRRLGEPGKLRDAVAAATLDRVVNEPTPDHVVRVGDDGPPQDEKPPANPTHIVHLP